MRKGPLFRGRRARQTTRWARNNWPLLSNSAQRQFQIGPVPDILLSDLNMPRMSGFELLSVVRRRFPEVFVIASSAAFSGEEVPAGIAADAFYEKSTGLTRLFELVKTATHKSHVRGGLTHPLRSGSHGRRTIPYLSSDCRSLAQSASGAFRFPWALPISF